MGEGLCGDAARDAALESDAGEGKTRPRPPPCGSPARARRARRTTAAGGREGGRSPPPARPPAAPRCEATQQREVRDGCTQRGGPPGEVSRPGLVMGGSSLQ